MQMCSALGYEDIRCAPLRAFFFLGQWPVCRRCVTLHYLALGCRLFKILTNFKWNCIKLNFTKFCFLHFNFLKFCFLIAFMLFFWLCVIKWINVHNLIRNNKKRRNLILFFTWALYYNRPCVYLQVSGFVLFFCFSAGVMGRLATPPKNVLFYQKQHFRQYSVFNSRLTEELCNSIHNCVKVELKGLNK